MVFQQKPFMTILTRLGVVGFTALWFALAQSRLGAAEVYVLRFRTNVLYASPPCTVVDWRDELLFHNGTAADKTVLNLATTAGEARPPGRLVVPAGRTHSTLGRDGLRDLGGDPFGAALLVNKLDVPEGVVVSSRADVFGRPPDCGGISSTIYSFGNLPLPVIRSLMPANGRQVHLTVDLGIYRRRTNVIVYNGGSASATARIEFRAGCDDALLSERFVAIGANSVVQVQGFSDDPLGRSCLGAGLTTDFTRYIVVTVDQPSFSHVVTISNEFLTPTIGVTVSSPQ